MRESYAHQVRVIDQFASNHPELQKSLNLRKLVLTVQNSLDSKKGTSINWSEKMVISGLQQNAFKLKQPISILLDPYVFDLGVLFSFFEKVVKELVEWKIKEREVLGFLAKVKNRKEILRGYIKAALKNDVTYFKRQGKKARLEKDLLFFIADTMVQPCLSEIARQMDKSFFEMWGWVKPSCPVCGRLQVVAKHISGKRYLTCMLCGAEYPVDIFLCIYCGNRDPKSLKFIYVGKENEFYIDFCEKCKRYLKGINVHKLKDPIPKGLEDILTLRLDDIAKQIGLSLST